MTPLECAARELREVFKRNGCAIAGDEETGWKLYTNDARRVIAAIRRPSATVFNKALASDDVGPWGEYPEFWIAMIDAITEQGMV